MKTYLLQQKELILKSVMTVETIMGRSLKTPYDNRRVTNITTLVDTTWIPKYPCLT